MRCICSVCDLRFADGCLAGQVRTGHKTQGIALFTRMGDRFSTWDVSNGLQSIIPTLLTSSVAGYPFCLPDMIGKSSVTLCAPQLLLGVVIIFGLAACLTRHCPGFLHPVMLLLLEGMGGLLDVI